MLEKLELGLKKITMPLPFALDHVHCFIAQGEDGWTVMDAGLNIKKTAALWYEVLEKKPVERLILTHLHPDHVGYAGVLQQQTGASVWMTARDSEDLQKVWVPEAVPKLEETYQKSAMPKELSEQVVQNIEKFYDFVLPLPETNHYLQDGEEIMIGHTPFEVIFTPGHAAGLVCFFNHEKGVLLSTDHVLPKITPNIAYWFYGEENPLQSFEDSLQRIKKLDAEFVIPSHGEPFIGANNRIDEIWGHHEKRLAQTLERAKKGVTVYDMCKVLFRRELSVYDYQFAIGETIAHLEYLVAKNVLERDVDQGVWYYRYRY